MFFCKYELVLPFCKKLEGELTQNKRQMRLASGAYFKIEKNNCYLRLILLFRHKIHDEPK